MILIAGDSWGCGEWVTGGIRNYQLNHYGLNQYLYEAGHEVVNFSRPGGSNYESEAMLKNFMSINQQYQGKIKCVIVFQTEWTRDYQFKTPEELTEDLGYGYVTLRDRWISRFYVDLSNLSQLHHVPVYLIGGCSDTMWLSKFSEEYPGVSVICQSLTNLAINHEHRIDHPVYSLFGNVEPNHLSRIKNNSQGTDLEQLIADIEQGNQRMKLWLATPEFFYPDGTHANQVTHKLVYDLLKEQRLI